MIENENVLMAGDAGGRGLQRVDFDCLGLCNEPYHS